MEIMTRSGRKEREALDRLADAFVEDVLCTTDDDILAELHEDFGDPIQLANKMRGLFERVYAEANKVKLFAAKQAVEASKRTGKIASVDLAEAKRRYHLAIARDPDLSASLTLAARKGHKQSEKDMETEIEDLLELGALGREDADE
jgi:hypothetical protein